MTLGLNNVSTKRLLATRLCDLKLQMRGSWLDRCVARLHAELRSKGFAHFRPHVWFADEWCSPDGVPGIAVPFYLAHPRLMRLERRMMFEVEGGTQTECMQLLRHEAAHALQHAYHLERKRDWQKTFGLASVPYPDSYCPNPMSKEFVHHLDGWYAQAHPVEDFAETFAVWLTPRSSWEEEYKAWPAIDKLKYMDRLVGRFGNTKPPVRTRAKPYALSQFRHTLQRHYERRQQHYSPGFSRDYDRDLHKIFSDNSRHSQNETAASFLRRNRKRIREQVAQFTGEYQFTVDQVLRDLIGRCKELGLRLCQERRQTEVDFAIMLTVHTVHLLHRRDEWHPL